MKFGVKIQGQVPNCADVILIPSGASYILVFHCTQGYQPSRSLSMAGSVG